MKIAILSAADVAGWYTATLMERGTRSALARSHRSGQHD
ncbi:hypothetical protein ACVWW4_006601 [Bradyrhizobium sp. LB7.1]